MFVGAVKINVALLLPGVTLISVGALGNVDNMPVPFRGIAWGLPAESLVTNMLPVRAPDAVGVKATFRLHEAPIAKLFGQTFVKTKSPLLEILMIFRIALPELVNVRNCAALVVPIFWLEKLRELGLNETTGAAAPVGNTTASIHAASILPPVQQESFSYDQIKVWNPAATGTVTRPHGTSPDAPTPPVETHVPPTDC